MDFHDYRLLNMIGQLVVEIVFSCFWIKNYKKHSFVLQHDQKAVFWVEESLK